MQELNTYQMKALTALIHKVEARFTDMNTEGLTSDQFTYHVKKLIELGLIEKTENEMYRLTQEGVVYVGHIDGKSGKILRHSQPIVIAVCTKKENGFTKYLIHKRLKHPDYGFYSLPEGKLEFGESIETGVLRELFEETGLKGSPILKEIKHIMHSKNGEILKDNFFYSFLIENPTGELINTSDGENFWMSLEEYKSLESVYSDNLPTIENIFHTDLSFFEKTIDWDTKEML